MAKILINELKDESYIVIINGKQMNVLCRCGEIILYLEDKVEVCDNS